MEKKTFYNAKKVISIEVIDKRPSQCYEFISGRKKSFWKKEIKEGFYFWFGSYIGQDGPYSKDQIEAGFDGVQYLIDEYNKVFVKPKVVINLVEGFKQTLWFDDYGKALLYATNISKSLPIVIQIG